MAGCVWNVSPEDRLCKYCVLTNCQERLLKKKRWGVVTPALRGMSVGQRLRLDHGYFGAARTAASRIGEETARRYVVRREERGVIVDRIS